VGDIEGLFRSEHAPLWRALAAFAGDEQIASDAEAEAITQLISRGDAVRNGRAWLWAAAFKIARGMLKERSAVIVLTSEGEGHAEPPVQLGLEFADLIRHTSSQQRACLVLRYITDLDNRQIARVLHTSPVVVGVQLHRAHRRVAASIERRNGSSQEV
jgi:DNA-directed RNA polymerase specialized sigma24 family protein